MRMNLILFIFVQVQIRDVRMSLLLLMQFRCHNDSPPLQRENSVKNVNLRRLTYRQLVSNWITSIIMLQNVEKNDANSRPGFVFLFLLRIKWCIGNIAKACPLNSCQRTSCYEYN